MNIVSADVPKAVFSYLDNYLEQQLLSISLLATTNVCSFHLYCFLAIGIYFGNPRGFGTNDSGDEIGFNTEVYAAYEVMCGSLCL